MPRPASLCSVGLAAIALLCMTLAGEAGSQDVVRCTDASGRAIYTDDACPAGSRAVGRVPVPGVDKPSPQEAERRRQLQEESSQRARDNERAAAVRASPAPAPAGPTIIDTRRAAGTDNSAAERERNDSRWSDRGTGEPAIVIDDGYGPGYGNALRPRVDRPRDMRPRLRDCDARGCTDTMGNRYGRSGELRQYQGPNGTTCTPVGTTSVCR